MSGNNLLKVSRDTLYTVAYSNLYTMLLVYVYINQISTTFAYAGFPLDYNYIHVALCLCVVTLISLTMNSLNTVVNRVMQILIVFFFIPALVYLSVADFNGTYTSLLIFSLVLLNLINRYQIRIRTLGIRADYIFFTITGISFAIVLMSMSTSNQITLNFNILEVYEHRSDNADALPGIFNYINSILAKVLIPLGIVFALYRRNFFLVFSFLILGVLLFGIGQHKSYLLAPVMPLMYYFMIRMSQRQTQNIFLIPIFLVLLSIIETIIIDNYFGLSGIGFVNSFFIRRSLFLPIFLDIETIKFFESNAIYLWSSSKITLGMVAMPYEQKAAFTMGYHLFGDPDHAANTGLIGSGFANGRFAGSLLYIFIIISVLLLLNRLRTDEAHIVVGSATASMFLFAFNTTDLVTMFLSHGLFMVVLMPFVLKSREG